MPVYAPWQCKAREATHAVHMNVRGKTPGHRTLTVLTDREASPHSLAMRGGGGHSHGASLKSQAANHWRGWLWRDATWAWMPGDGPATCQESWEVISENAGTVVMRSGNDVMFPGSHVESCVAMPSNNYHPEQ